MSRPDLFCLYCRNKASKGPKCIKCDRVFHPKCVERLNIEVIDDEQVICCTGMEEKSDDVLEFLKSEEFSELEIKIQRSRDDGGYSNTNSSKLKTTIPSKNLTTKREQQKDLIDIGPKKLRDNNSTVKTADFDIEKVERDNDRSSNGWIQVQSKRRINKKWSGVRGKANTEKSSGLTAANRKAYIYAGNFENSTKEDVKDYLSKIFPNETIEVEKLTRRDDARSISFKIITDRRLLEHLYNPDNWPENVLIKRYQFFPKKQNNLHESESISRDK
ncbi:hypothetical protein TcasGA2_TC001994 [Tribolium castaneum]|uniref:Uncharacterized protein n=1 Tax=Tribolium castaneum TaxID=7070 RepID=D7EHZ4_TRICA|nr:hypothetical protein TcasGA2_TC001994 [Tribolium castaneum]